MSYMFNWNSWLRDINMGTINNGVVFVLLGVKECTQEMKIISKDDRFSVCG